MENFATIISIYESFVTQPHMHVAGHTIGLFGMACIVLAYYLIETGGMNRDDIKYYWLNLSGACLLVLSLLINFNLGSFVIEIFWIAISILGMIRLNKKSLNPT